MSRYTKEELQEAASNSVSVADMLRYFHLRASGGNHTAMSRRLYNMEVDTSHFLGQAHSRGKIGANRKSPEEVLTQRKSGSRVDSKQMRRVLQEAGVPLKCVKCGVRDTYNSLPITLHVDHINADFLDNRLENLRFLCPNCHSQQETTSSGWAGHPHNKNRETKPLKTCVSCSVAIKSSSTRCNTCANRRSRQDKITWPPLEDLLHLVETTSYSSAGRELGVSDNAVRKRIKRLQQEASK